MKALFSIIIGLLSLISASAYSADVKVCSSCNTDSQFTEFARLSAHFNRTIDVNIFNDNTRVLRQYSVTQRQEILPNGEILFPTYVYPLATDSELQQQLSDLLDLKEIQHEEVLTVLAAKTQFAIFNDIYVPESIAESPWDLIGNSYARTKLGNYINPSKAGSYWESPIAHSDLISTYLINYLSLGLTELLDLNIFVNKLTTLKFKSGGTITFELTGFSNGFFDFDYGIKFPILDSSGNVVADNLNDLKGSRDFEGTYVFESGSAIDKNAFTDAASNSNWQIISVGDSKPLGLVCVSSVSADDIFTLICYPM
jgi:hypothetical protein